MEAQELTIRVDENGMYQMKLSENTTPYDAMLMLVNAMGLILTEKPDELEDEVDLADAEPTEEQ